MILLAEITPSSILAFQKDGKEFPIELALDAAFAQYPDNKVKSWFKVRNRTVLVNSESVKPSFGFQINLGDAPSMGFVS